MKKLIIDGNDVYEIDLECIERHKNIDTCKIPNIGQLSNSRNHKKYTDTTTKKEAD